MKGTKRIMHAIMIIMALAILATFTSASIQHATQAPEPEHGCGGGSVEPEEPPIPEEEPTPPKTYTTTYATHSSSSVGVNTKRTWILDKVIRDDKNKPIIKIYHYQTYKVRGCKYSDWPYCKTKNYYNIIKTERTNNWIG